MIVHQALSIRRLINDYPSLTILVLHVEDEHVSRQAIVPPQV